MLRSGLVNFNELVQAQMMLNDPEGKKTLSLQKSSKKTHDNVLEDPKLKVGELAEAEDTSIGSVVKIFHDNLGMRNLIVKWVPLLLTIDEKRQHVRDFKSCLNLFNHNPSDFMRRLVTIDETWIHHYSPEYKEQAKQWVEPGGTAPKRAKTQQLAGKVKRGNTINNDYY